MASAKESQKKPTDQKKNRSENQRATQIMEVALELFAEQGVSRVTIKDIGHACGFNSALIYYYFENKEDLFRASIEHAIKLMLESYSNLGKLHEDPYDLINDWFQVNIQLQKPLRRLAKVMSDYMFSGSRFPSVDRLFKQLYAQECRILEENIEKCQQEGVFKIIDPKVLSRFVSIHLDGIFFASMIRSDLNIEEMVEELKALLWNQIADGDLPPLTSP